MGIRCEARHDMDRHRSNRFMVILCRLSESKIPISTKACRSVSFNGRLLFEYTCRVEDAWISSTTGSDDDSIEVFSVSIFASSPLTPPPFRSLLFGRARVEQLSRCSFSCSGRCRLVTRRCVV